MVEFFADEDNCAQGTAFFLAGVGLVTAYHVLEKLPHGTYADIYRPSDGGNKFKAKPSKRICPNRDLMILEHDVPTTNYLSMPVVTSPEQRDDKIVALGFPDYGPGDQLSKRPGQIYGNATKHGVKLLEVSAILTDGISGGPIINDQHQVIGVAQKGGIQERKQLAVEVSELLKLAGE